MIELLLNVLISDYYIYMIENSVYYLLITVAIVLCWRLVYKRLIVDYEKRRIRTFVFVCVVFATAAGVVGSLSANMFYYPLETWNIDFFFDQIVQADRHTFHGGLILSTLMFLALMVVFRLNTFQVVDAYFLYLPVGHAIGRAACLVIGCCWGKFYRITLFNRSFIINNPTPAYSIVFLLVLFMVLRALYERIYSCQKHIEYRGLVTGTYLILYGIFRYVMEFFRTELIVVFGLTQAQLIMIVFFLIGLVLFTFIGIKAHVRKVKLNRAPV